MKPAISRAAIGLAISTVAVLTGLSQTPVQPPAAAPKATQSTPKNSKAAAPRAAAPSSYKDLKFPPLRPLVAPPVEPVTLPNGMRLLLVEDHSSSVINGMAVVRTGNLFDPKDRVGLAALTGQAMRTGGTPTYTPEQLNLTLEDMAATLESSIGETSGSVSFSGLPEDADPLLLAFKEVLTQPEFRQDRVEQARLQLRANITRGNEDSAFVLRREFANTIYGKDNPYGWPIEYASVDHMTRADVLSFYKRYYFPKNTLLAVWGDFDSTQMKAKIEKLFAGWTAEQPPVPEFPKVTGKPSGSTFLIRKNGAAPTLFSIGSLGGESRDKDFAALEVMAEVLGGGNNSRLARRLRTEGGGTATASWAAGLDHAGLFQISGSVPAFQTVKALRAAKAEAAAIRTAEVSEEELAAARERALDRLVYSNDTKSKIMQRLVTYEYFGYPRDFLQQYQKSLEAVSRADVLRVAKEHIDPDRLTVVVVGNPISFEEQLDKLGAPVTAIDLPGAAPAPATVVEGEANRQRGKDLLARAQTAAGGADKLAAVKDFTLETSFQFDASVGGMLVTETDRWMSPSYFRQDSVMPAGKITAYIAGETGWISTPQGTGALAGTQLKQVQGDQFRAFLPMLLSDRSVDRAVKALDATTVEISDKGGQVVRLVTDPNTGLPTSVAYETETATGPVAVTDTYSDYRDVAGVKLPFHISITAGGRKYAEVTVKSFKTNTGLLVKDLEKKP
jgi:zinc protease